jgi:hypothetical protein
VINAQLYYTALSRHQTTSKSVNLQINRTAKGMLLSQLLCFNVQPTDFNANSTPNTTTPDYYITPQQF